MDASGNEQIDALWGSILQRLSASVAHELRGALNGVSVNLEVVRSRSERPETPASAVCTFANAASGQLDAVISMTEGLLGLARGPREPVSIGLTVRQVSALLGPAGRADGKILDVGDGFDAVPATPAPGSGVRLAIGAALLASTDASVHVRCSAESDITGGPAIRVESCDGMTFDVGRDIVAALAGAGIRVSAESAAITIKFPR